ncbi:MFS transporter [Thermosipho ferrireducens]|uniref:MFS transporter n=1 Tax=Thermosipho ferrireducens TaxID=2571116 RepID=A0ABX7S9Q6_9BACT|nr:MFS transporter [Thermosipho ferrireducens]QTA38646.1 MFS transporter [Thermosipho ferrireducens]
MKKAEKFIILEGIFSNFYFVLTQGVVFTSLAIYFGLNEVLLGITSAFPMIFQLFQLLTPPIIEKFKYRKKLLLFFNSFKLLWFVILLELFFDIKSVFTLIIVFAITQAFSSLAGNTWTSLVTDLIKPEIRGRYFGIRSVFVSFSTLLLFYLYSAIIDNVAEPKNYLLVIFTTLIGIILGLISLVPVEDPPVKVLGTFTEIRKIFSERNFIKLSLANMYWNFALLLAAPFFSYHQLKNLKIPMTYISYATIAMTLLSMVFYFVWGKISDKFGHKTVLISGISFVAISPAVWILMNENHWPFGLAIDALISGIGWAAINLTFLTLPMEVAKSSSPIYFAVFASFGGIGGLIGSIFGGYLAFYFNKLNFYINGYHLFGLQIFFLIESFLRLLAIPIFARIRTQKYISPITFMFSALNTIARRPTQRIYEQAKLSRPSYIKKIVPDNKRIQRWW